MRRILLLDGQVFHTPALHRGMGKYSLELIRALAEANKQSHSWDEIQLILSSRIKLDDVSLRHIERHCAGVKIVRLVLKEDEIYAAQKVMTANRHVVDKHVASLRHSDLETQIDYLILSPMQGGICSVFPSAADIQKAAVFYDLIPYMFHNLYFRNPIAAIENLTKLTELVKADAFLAISETVANDLAVYLGISPERIVSIDGGPIPHAEKEVAYPVEKPFILMPTGDDLRKNNRTGVLGFVEFNQRHDNKYSLVVTSFFDPEVVRELSSLSKDIIFTGNISGGQLKHLYEHCEVLLFPSEYEGLGLPVLEAAAHGKPVACSDIAVFREISRTAFCYFDPAYGTSVAKALDKAIKTKPSQKTYETILAKYNWQRTAESAITQLSKTAARETRAQVEIFGLSPARSTESSELLAKAHAELGHLFDVRYFIDGTAPSNPFRPDALHYLAQPVAYGKETAAQAIIYHIEDDPQLSKTLFAALARPGILVLHDLKLGTVWQGVLEQGLIDQGRLAFEQGQSERYEKETALLVSVAARQKAIVVFGNEAKAAMERLFSRLPDETPPIFALPYPMGRLVYEAITPAKTRTVGAVLEGGAAAVAHLDAIDLLATKVIIGREPEQDRYGADLHLESDEFERLVEEHISRLSILVAEPHQLVPIATAIRYGIPIALIGTAEHDYIVGAPGVEIIEPGDLRGLQKTLQSLRQASQNTKARAAFLEEHSYQQFAAGLKDIITSLGE